MKYPSPFLSLKALGAVLALGLLVCFASPSLFAQTNTNGTNAEAPFVITPSFQTGDPVPGATNTNATFVSFGNPAFNALNGVAFQATVKEVDLVTNYFPVSSSVTMSTNLATNTWSGIWADDASGHRNLVIRTGAEFGFGSSFTFFSDPVYNNSNSVAFVGVQRTIFATPAIAFPGGTPHFPTDPFPADYQTGIWTTQPFANAATNTNNIYPVITYHGNQTPVTNWVTNPVNILNLLPQLPPNLTLVATLGSAAPGYSNNATFSSFDQIALPDQGGVVLLATVSTSRLVYPPTRTNPLHPMPMYVLLQPLSQQGIWAQDTTGSLNLIAHVGETISVNGISKVIASLSFLNSGNQPSLPGILPLQPTNAVPNISYPSSPVTGQTRSFNQDTGNLFFKATFTDGTQAGMKVIFP
jgi:hypothetical protein